MDKRSAEVTALDDVLSGLVSPHAELQDRWQPELTAIVMPALRYLRTGETGSGAAMVQAVLRADGMTAAQPDLGALLSSTCSGCCGPCGGHSVGQAGMVFLFSAKDGRATPDQVARYMTRDFWIEKGEIPHAWDTSRSNVITVNLSAVSDEMKVLIRAALEAWETVADIAFREVTGRAGITFTTGGSGATTTAQYQTDGKMVRATVMVTEGFVDRNGQSLGSYSLQTYIHEIGHALGLGHPGGYGLAGGTRFSNDSWQMSALSYTGQNQISTIVADRAVAVTPMMADIIAVQSLYGAASSGPTKGNTIYGQGATLGTYLDSVFAGQGGSLGSNAITIFDESGRDRIDLSSDTRAQRVDLNGQTYSDVFGKRGNLAIAKGTVIEDYVAGSGADRVTGNAAANSISGRDGDDTILGRDGNDVVDGGLGNDSLSGGKGTDRIVGSAGDDRAAGDAGDDRLDGGEGNDVLRGDAGNDVIYGRAGNDVLAGGAGNDRCYGDEGDDVVSGDAGSDTLWGGAGHDTLNGGLGADVLVFDSGSDLVQGFTDNVDTLWIDDSLFNGQKLSAVQVLNTYATFAGGAVLFDFGGGNILRVEGVSSVGALQDDLVIV